MAVDFEKAAKKAEAARKRMRAYQVSSKIADGIVNKEIPGVKLQRTFNETTGKAGYELTRSEKGIKAPEFTNTKRLMRKAAYEARGYIDQKIAENEEDNTGIEAARKTENAGENAAITIKNTLPSNRAVFRRAQQELRKKARRSEEEYRRKLFQKQEAERQREAIRAASKTGSNVVKGTTKTTTNTVAKEGTKGAVKTGGKKAVNKAGKGVAKEAVKEEGKKQVRRAYTKLFFRRAQKEAAKQAAKKGAEIAATKAAEGTVATGTVGTAGTVAVNAAGLATGVEEVLLIIVAVIVLIILIVLLIAMIITTILLHSFYMTNIAGGMYLSEPTEIEAAELHMSYLEASLVEYIEDIENKEPDYDGYVLDDSYSVWHNPYTLINYLSAKYEEFEYSDVEAEIDDLFNTRYTLITWVEDITQEVEDDEDEDDNDDDEDEDDEDEDEEPETITLHILHLRLVTNDSLENIVAGRLNDEQKEQYALYEETHGGLQFIASPIGTDYSSNISSYYGYRYHPISNTLSLHRGLDIALPEGTDLYAGIDGVVTTVGYDENGYGNYVVIKDSEGEEVRYAHMKEVSVSVGDSVKRGQTVLGQSGNTGASTGPHVHIEYLQNGDYHNPLFYLETDY